MEFEDLRNASGLTFTDISAETKRTYRFPGGDTVTILNPLGLNVSASGGHRIFAAEGCHYVPSGWIHLAWVVKDGEPHFDL